MYIHDSIEGVIVQTPMRDVTYTKKPEFIFAQLHIDNLRVLAGVIYNPPDSPWST